MASKLEKYKGGAAALLKAKQPLSVKTLGKTKRPDVFNIKVGAELKGITEKLAKENNVPVSLLIRWLLFKFEADSHES